MKYLFFRAFPALSHRNYQLWASGQFVSLIGTWIQMIAQGWLVLELTHAALWVSIIAALNSLPILLLTLFGGLIVDRFSKRKVLFIAEFSAMILAFTLGFLTIFHLVTVWHIAVLAFLLGVVSAIDMPARLAFSFEMVDKKSLSSALALNAGMFNGARVVGPGLAGYLIAFVGLGGAFLVNGISFIAVLIAMLFMRTTPSKPVIHPHPFLAIRQGLSYAFSNVIIRRLLIFSGFISIFGWSYMVILPVVVKNTFHMDASGLGLFNAVAGLGALIGSFLISGLSRMFGPWKFILTGSFLFAFSLFIFSFTTNLYIALLCLFGIGLGLIMQFATINSAIQHVVVDSLRGRVMSVYTLMFLGMTPFGSLQIGFLSQQLGTAWALRISSLVVLGISLLFLLKRVKRPGLEN